MAPQCIDDCGGLFAAVEGDDAAFAGRFPEYCAAAGIDCQVLTPAQARELEPALSDRTFAAYAVPDATVDPFRITLENVNHAQQLTGSIYLPHTEVTGFEIEDGVIRAALCRDNRTGQPRRILAKQVVNAAGAWAMDIARLAGCSDVSLLYSKGTLIITNTRVSDRVINRLRPPGDGDILVPGGTVSVLGTTSDTVASPEQLKPTIKEVDRNLVEGVKMVPSLERTRFIRAFSGVRPLIKSAGAETDGRKASRGFTLLAHEDQGVSNFATITGGKLTTFRLMSEKTGDLVAARLGNKTPCKTANEPLPSGDAVRWTEPGFAAHYWFKRQDPQDMILCECEMVPQSAVDKILDAAPGAEKEMTLQSIGVRSRVGKGSCQGSFCAIRVGSYLYDQGVYDSPNGLTHIRDFVSGRFKGVRPVLWGEHMAQAELAEALHCGLMGLDKFDPDRQEQDAPSEETSGEAAK